MFDRSPIVWTVISAIWGLSACVVVTDKKDAAEPRDQRARTVRSDADDRTSTVMQQDVNDEDNDGDTTEPAPKQRTPQSPTYGRGRIANPSAHSDSVSPANPQLGPSRLPPGKPGGVVSSNPASGSGSGSGPTTGGGVVSSNPYGGSGSVGGGVVSSNPAGRPSTILPPGSEPREQTGMPFKQGVRVACDFDDGWAALVPMKLYGQDDFLMQALIGLAQDSKFWINAGYGKFSPHTAKRCTSRGVIFDEPAGTYKLLVGRANTFKANGAYKDNGRITDIKLPGRIDIRLSTKDLNHTWVCISCPHLYAWNGTTWVYFGEILRDVIGAGAQTTQRIPLRDLPIVDGMIRLRLVEEEDEVSHVDALLLEIDGTIVKPAQVADLANADGQYRVLRKGEAVELEYRVASAASRTRTDARIVATGYYVPLAPLR